MKKSPLKKLISFSLHKHKPALIRCLFLLVGVNVVELLWPRVLQLYIDSFDENVVLSLFGLELSFLSTKQGQMWMLPGMLMCLALLRWLVNYFKIIQLGKLGQNILVKLRSRVYAVLQTESFSYHDRRHSGSLIANLIEDVRFSTMFFEHALFNFIEALSFTIFAWIALTIKVPIVGLTVATIMIISFFCGIRCFRKNLILMNRSREKTALMVKKFGELMEGRLLIEAYGMNEQCSEDFDKKVQQMQDTTLKEVWRIVLVHQFVSWGAILSIFAGVGVYLLQCRLEGVASSAGVLVYITSILLLHLQKARMVAWSNDNILRFLITSRRLREFVDKYPQFLKQQEGLSSLSFDSLEFSNVAFEYIPGKKILEDVSFKVAKGETLAIIGQTGAGKSTLIQLLCGFYEASEGVIALNGVSLAEHNRLRLRQATGIVFQESFLFSGSIRENVAFALPAVQSTEDELIQDELILAAAESADALEFIEELPDKMYSPLGEKGISLSGGQRQRLSLARALCSRPPVLVLDSCTSALDTETEQGVLERLREWQKEGLTVLISHRASAIMQADKVLILDQGNVIGFGKPSELKEQINNVCSSSISSE